MKLFTINLSVIGADGTPEVVIIAMHSASAMDAAIHVLGQYPALVSLSVKPVRRSNPIMSDPVDIDLARYHTDLDTDEGMVEWLADRQIKEATAAQAALESPVAWEWDSATHVLTNTSKVPYTADDVLTEALDQSEEARAAYAALMASPAAEKLRQLLAEHWAFEMWETRTHSEINAAIAAEREDF